jgi:predicted restriction endonuclease
MRPPQPLTDEEGEVRELTLRDIRRFRPMAEGLSPALAAKLDIEIRLQEKSVPMVSDRQALIRNQAEARKVAAKHYPFRCCVICGLQLPASLMVAHLDHHSGNDLDNIAYLCGTHHWMHDAGRFPLEAIKLLRAHWQKTEGRPDHKPPMKDAGAKTALARKRSATARTAWQTRRRPSETDSSR